MAGKTAEMVGKKFNMLTVLSVATPVRFPSGQTQQMLNCVCDCGNLTTVSYSHLKNNGVKSCGCLKHIDKCKDLTGMKFYKLTVIRRIGTQKIGTQGQTAPLWECQCDCGKIVNVNSRSLMGGNTKSCGCIQGETLRKSNLNTYDITGKHGIGYLKNGKTFLFDLEDYDLIKNYTWHENDNGYIVTTYKNERIRMHRLILNVGKYHDPSNVVDHINRNPSDNRKGNLRVCAQRENMRNKIEPSNNTSGHIGVIELKDSGLYRAFITIDGRYKSLGEYEDINDAIKARIDAEEKYWGEFAPIRNEVKECQRTQN